jgi:hypothetical protein
METGASNFSTSFEYFDPNCFNEKYQYKTTIMLSADGCSVSGLSMVDNTFNFLGSYPDIKINLGFPLLQQLSSLLESKAVKDLINFSKDVIFLINESRFTLIPNVFYLAEKSKQLFTLSNEIHPDEILITDSLDSIDQKLVFPINPFLKEFIDQLQVKTTIHSALTSFIESSGKAQKEASSIHVNLSKNNLQIIYFKNAELNFVNNFDYHTLEDGVYFMVYCIEQLNLSQSTQKVILSGETEEKSEFIRVLKEYIPSIQMQKRSTAYSYFFKLNLIENHRFIHLLN